MVTDLRTETACLKPSLLGCSLFSKEEAKTLFLYRALFGERERERDEDLQGKIHGKERERESE